MRQPPRRMNGQTPLARAFNALLDYAISITPVSSSTVKVRTDARGTCLIASPGSAAAPSQPASGAGRFTLVSEVGDYIVCTNSGGILVQIAKPWLLRNSILSRTYDGQTWAYQYTSAVQRTVSVAGSVISYQRVSPRYAAGDIIYADQPGAAIIGVNSVAGDGTTIPAGTAVVWMDQNRDGRAWADTANNQP